MAHIGVSDKVSIEECEVINLEDYETPSDYKLVVTNPELMTNVENLVQRWSKQIEQVNNHSCYI